MKPYVVRSAELSPEERMAAVRMAGSECQHENISTARGIVNGLLLTSPLWVATIATVCSKNFWLGIFVLVGGFWLACRLVKA